MDACRWLWNDVQDDLKLLQKEYKKLGYNYTLEECYDIWQAYSEICHANWIINFEHIEDSLDIAKEIVGDDRV